ncbi:MAG: DUF4829 domain-containing protein [Tissierella sp.]|uniref:DUF4829 domain-containing protein n=1 Tax=Tissierella sp. TaxID=41274 RepID=UPI003F97A175
MKKNIILLSIIFLTFTLIACKQDRKVDNIIIDLGESTKFSQEEVKEAIDTVKDNFDFKGCTLKKLLYDEEKSNHATSGYMGNGRGSINEVKAENVLVILSEFDVDSVGGDGSFNPNSTYDDFQFILIRDGKTSD